MMSRFPCAVACALLIFAQVSRALDCPDSCNCYNAPDSLIEANCTDLIKLQKYLNSEKTFNLDILKLSDPTITTINGQLDKLNSLSILDLSGNNLSSVKKLPKNVVKLDLSNNFLKSIEDLPQSVKEVNLRGNRIIDLSYKITSLKHLRRFFLENNSLACSCETIQVRDWLIKSYISTDKPFCLTDQGKQILLSEVKTSDVCLKVKTKYDLEDLMQGDDPLGGSVFQGSGSEPDDEDLFITVSSKPPSNDSHDEKHSIYEGSGESDFDFIDQAVTYDDIAEESTSTTEAVKSTTEQPLKKPSPMDDTEDEEEESGSGSGSGDGGILPFNDYDEFDAFFASEIPTTEEPVTSSSSFFDWNPFSWFSGSNTATEEVSESTPEAKVDDEKDDENDEVATTETLITEAPIIPKVVEKIQAEVQKTVPEEKVEVKTDEETESKKDVEDDVELGNVRSEQDGDNVTTYACLGVLSLLLLLLIIFVIFKKRKSDKKRKRQGKRDVESRGTEMRDMNKKLMEQNSAKPAVNGKNGNFETDSLLPNGDKKPVAMPRIVPSTIDPKPALEKLLDPKADAIETYDNVPLPKNVAPVSSNKGSSVLHPVNDHDRSNDYKVKTKLKEIPESLPKTPVLVNRTRSNAGDIIVTPVNKNGLNGNTGR